MISGNKFNNDYLVAIDYDEQNDMIIIGSQNRSRKLWECKIQSVLINKE